MLKQAQTASLLQRNIRFSWAVPVSGGNTAKMPATESTVRSQPAAPAPDPPAELKQNKPPPRGPSFMFPLGYKDAAYQWWTSVTPPMAERNVLSFIPYIKETSEAFAGSTATDDTRDPYGNRVWRRSMVQLSGKNRAMNEVSIERVGEKEEETLVMLHGYGAGLGFFYKNLEPISRIKGLKLYALDMLGMGNSSRPPFKVHGKTRDEKITDAENWFIDALEEWRQARKIERFTLLGHSLGGYLAVSYAIKYPGHLKKLILASPVGFPEDPYAVNASLPEPGESTLQNEFSEDQQTVTQDRHPSQTVAKPGAAPPKAPRRPLPGWFVWLWDQNISPFSIVRLSGPLGPRFVSGWSSRRFNHLPEDEAQALHDYSFSIFKQKGSGEYALAHILAPGAYARRPMINRIAEVGRQTIQPADGGEPKKETGFPIVFMYGENDWMDVAGGLASEERLKEAKFAALQTATEEEKRKENGSSSVLIVPKAGHHLYLDNPDVFNDMLRKEVEGTMRAEKKRKQQELSSS